MSRVAKKPVQLPQGVSVAVNDGAVTVKGAKGALSLALTAGVTVAQEQQNVVV